MKGSLSVHNHSTLVLTIKSGKLDLIQEANNHNAKLARNRGTTPMVVTGHFQHNPYSDEGYSPIVSQFYTEVFAAMNDGNWDKSDIQTDYFNVGWYSDIDVGKWDKPYILTK
jgi:hypothetical protein